MNHMYVLADFIFVKALKKPNVEPLDAFVASLSDKELSRKLIIDSKDTLGHGDANIMFRYA